MNIDFQEAAIKRLIKCEANGLKSEKFILSEVKERITYIPDKKLYKFRKITNKNLRSLENNEIWLPCASYFKDAFDASVNIDLEKDAPVVEDLLLDAVYEKWQSMLNEYLSSSNMPLLPSKENLVQFGNKYNSDDLYMDAEKIFEFMTLHCGFPNDSLAINQLKAALDLYSKDLEEFKKSFEEKLNELNRNLETARDVLRTSKAVYCMSETVDNPKQWEEYADMYQGFAIEYCFDDIDDKTILQNDILLSLFPVVYIESRPRFELSLLADHIKKQLPTSLDHEDAFNLETKVLMHMFYKDKRYDSECEWRIFCCCENQQGVLLKFPFVSAIYVGKDIKPRNLTRLKNIAKTLGVPIYKQTMNRFKNGYNYVPIEEKIK